MNLDAIAIGHNPPEDVNTVIEVPIGGEPVKYEMDKAAGTLVVDRFLYTPMRYPGNYGFVPHTLSDDGDPIDGKVAEFVAKEIVGARELGVDIAVVVGGGNIWRGLTGAGSGMAKASARVFVREGAKVVAADISGAEKDTAAELGDAVLPVHCDVTDEPSVEAAMSGRSTTAILDAVVAAVPVPDAR